MRERLSQTRGDRRRSVARPDYQIDLIPIQANRKIWTIFFIGMVVALAVSRPNHARTPADDRLRKPNEKPNSHLSSCRAAAPVVADGSPEMGRALCERDLRNGGRIQAARGEASRVIATLDIL